jgi:hypothetical protein
MLQIHPARMVIDAASGSGGGVDVRGRAHVLFRFRPIAVGAVVSIRVFVTNEDGAVEDVYGLVVRGKEPGADIRREDRGSATTTAQGRSTVWS